MTWLRFGHVHTLLNYVIEGVPIQARARPTHWERKVVENRRAARIEAVARNDVETQRIVRRRARRIAETGALIGSRCNCPVQQWVAHKSLDRIPARNPVNDCEKSPLRSRSVGTVTNLALVGVIVCGFSSE
jgi:hypothetical protein